MSKFAKPILTAIGFAVALSAGGAQADHVVLSKDAKFKSQLFSGAHSLDASKGSKFKSLSGGAQSSGASKGLKLKSLSGGAHSFDASKGLKFK